MKRLMALALLASCRTVEDDLAELRAERKTLEQRLLVDEHAPAWPTDGDESFDRFVRDDDAEVPSFVHDHIVEKLRSRSVDSIRAETGEGFDPEKCIARPAAFRGKFWRVTGRIVRIWPEPVTGAHPPVDRIFAGVFFPEGGCPVYFHVIEKPDVLELGADTVEIDGLFVKVIVYHTSGGRTITSPFLIAKSMRKLM